MVTVTVAFTDNSPYETVIYAFPPETPVTAPSALTVAILSSLDSKESKDLSAGKPPCVNSTCNSTVCSSSIL